MKPPCDKCLIMPLCRNRIIQIMETSMLVNYIEKDELFFTVLRVYIYETCSLIRDYLEFEVLCDLQLVHKLMKVMKI